jgi:hypothetical protein
MIQPRLSDFQDFGSRPSTTCFPWGAKVDVIVAEPPARRWESA